MKKLARILLPIVILSLLLSTTAGAEEPRFLSEEIHQISSFDYAGERMKIQDVSVGSGYVLEFDINVAPNAPRGTLIFTHSGSKTNSGTHNSAMEAKGNKWSWTCSGVDSNVVVASELNCGVVYRISIGVDLVARKQYLSIRDAEGTTVGSAVIDRLSDADLTNQNLTTFQFQWANGFVDTKKETWSSSIKVSNVTIKYDSSYVADTPSVAFENGKAIASVDAYFNNLTAKSPTLLLCVYDKDNILVGVSATCMTGSGNKKETLKTEVGGIKLRKGYAAKAMVLNSMEEGLPFVPAASVEYSE